MDKDGTNLIQLDSIDSTSGYLLCVGDTLYVWQDSERGYQMYDIADDPEELNYIGEIRGLPYSNGKIYKTLGQMGKYVVGSSPKSIYSINVENNADAFIVKSNGISFITEEFIYYKSESSSGLERINLDGENPERISSKGNITIVNSDKEFLYYFMETDLMQTDYNILYRMKLDSSEEEEFVQFGMDSSANVFYTYVDVQGDWVYFKIDGGYPIGKIKRDGSQYEIIFE